MLIRLVVLFQLFVIDLVIDKFILCLFYWFLLICILGMMINIVLVIKLYFNDLLIIKELIFQYGLNLGNLIFKVVGFIIDFKYFWLLYY